MKNAKLTFIHVTTLIWALMPVLLSAQTGSGGTFISNGSGDFNSPSTWIAMGDANGIPDSNDDITILPGHTVSFSMNSACRQLTVDPGGTISSQGNTLIIHGDYVMNGTESGGGYYAFSGVGTLVDGTGTFSTKSKWTFTNNRTITANVNAIRNYWTRICNGATVTNLGNVTLASLVSIGTTGTWINGLNSTLIMKSLGITVNMDLGSYENTVKIQLVGSSPTLIPSYVGNTFHHLYIGNSSLFVRITTNTTINGNFTILTGGDFDMNGFNLSVKGNFTNNQNFIQTTGTTLTFDGTSTQNFNTDKNPFALQNVVINNASGVIIGGSGTFTIAESLTILSGNLDLGSNSVTLLSTATKTARIGQSAGTVTGSMIIERYVAAQPDGWTTMSSPVAGATFAQWEDDFALGFGPYIPNVSEPSAYGYNESAWDYYAIENNAYPINPTEGYEVYLATDYLVATPMVATVAELNGTPNIGDFTFNATVDNDGWNLIGNPYASFIDWETFRNNCGVSLSSEFMYFDEAINDYSVGYIGDEIAQSQGIWVEALSAGTITFHETDKTNSNSSAYRSSKEVLFALKVSSDQVKTTSHTYLRLDENADNHFIQGSDKSFFKHSDRKSPALFTHSSDGKKLRINELKAESELIIPVSFQAGLNGNYQIDMLNFEIAESAGYTTVILEDKKTGMFYNLLNGAYLFEANTNDEAERFVLYLSQSTETITASDIKFNPSPEGIWIEFETTTDPVSINIYNALGQELQESIHADPETEKVLIKLPESFSGVYIIQVTCGDKTTSKQFYKY